MKVLQTGENMKQFKIDNPVVVRFGVGVLRSLAKTVREFGNKVLLVYGQGSIKKSGLYDKVFDLLKSENMQVVEYGGILSNPRYQHIDEAARLASQEKVDVILAVGGGSVLDSAKIMAITTPIIDQHSSWDFFSGKPPKIETALPLVTVLTVAATGSEMNMFSVVQNDETKQKLSFGNYLMFPAHSFLDPQNTVTVNSFHTACGIADATSHSLENYFSTHESTLTDRFIESIIQELVEFGGKLMQNLEDVSLREKVMFSAMMALNGTTLHGKGSGDWGVHALEHSLSALYDIAHGAGLAILFPHWLEVQAQENEQVKSKVQQLGNRIFSLDANAQAQDTALAFRHFFNSLGLPQKLSDLKVVANSKDILENMKANNANGRAFPLSQQAKEEIVERII